MTLRPLSPKTIQVWNLWRYHMSTKMLQYHLPCQVFHLCRRCQKSNLLGDVKAKVSSITGVKTINSRYDHPLKKQEVLLVDHTTSIKLVLWQEHCDKREDQKTYNLQNLRLKETDGIRYLNTPKSEQFLYTKLGTSHYRDGVTNAENISQINWRPKRVKKSFMCIMQKDGFSQI